MLSLVLFGGSLFLLLRKVVSVSLAQTSKLVSTYLLLTLFCPLPLDLFQLPHQLGSLIFFVTANPAVK
jgi:hypothetical protein